VNWACSWLPVEWASTRYHHSNGGKWDSHLPIRGMVTMSSFVNPHIRTDTEGWSDGQSRPRLSLIGGGFSAAAASAVLIAIGLNSIPTRAPAPDPP
jgi:hypothetical protein